MRIEHRHSITEINRDEWNATVKSHDIFHHYDFLEALEMAKVEEADMHYLIFYNQDVVVATSVLSVFYLDLCIFIGNNSIIRQLKKNISKTVSYKSSFWRHTFFSWAESFKYKRRKI